MGFHAFDALGDLFLSFQQHHAIPTHPLGRKTHHPGSKEPSGGWCDTLRPFVTSFVACPERDLPILEIMAVVTTTSLSTERDSGELLAPRLSPLGLQHVANRHS